MDPTFPLPELTEYQRGYEHGLLAAAPISDLEVLSFGRALDALALHAATMDNHDEALHVKCLECTTLTLLSRVVHFGDQIRQAEKERS